MDVTLAEELVAANIDHLGIISSVAQEVGLVQKIDKLLPRYDVRRIVSAGQATLAMVLNGLGFSNHRLYLMPEFLVNKPLDKLIAPNLKPEHFDDHVLGRVLDEIAEYGSSKFFTEIAFEIAIEHNLLGNHAHIDTTTFSVDGDYNNEEPGQINVCHGYSKDKRQDLKQVVMNLVCTGPAELPIFMNPLDGNASDKKELFDGISTVLEFKNQIGLGLSEFTWIADSALYSKDRLLSQNSYRWITRIPETIKEAKILVSKDSSEINWTKIDDDYQTSLHKSDFGGISQSWILVHSLPAFNREKKTFEEKLEKQEEKLLKDIWHFTNQIFNCEEDARKALGALLKGYSYHSVGSVEAISIEKFEGRGRPKEGASKKVVGVSLKVEILRNSEAINSEIQRKGRFIIATNSTDNIDMNFILRSYKEQQSVERGFRFLKDPWFMADRLFLKSPKRIEALMAVMALCLMIYNIAQYKLRKGLEEKNETLPNQLKKQTATPTLRWIFQLMQGVIILRTSEDVFAENRVLNLSETRRKIIRIFGQHAQSIYETS